MKKLTVAFFLFILTIPSISFAANFSGIWNMNGNGYQMVIKITQTGNSINGVVVNSPGDTLSGSVNGNFITFTRTNSYLNTAPAHPQIYEGALFVKGQTTMAGRFKHRNSWHHGWYATK